LGECALVGAVGVVLVDVVVEVAFEAGEADVQVTGEGGSPALLEDQSVQRFDVAVGLRPAGADERVPRAESAQRAPGGKTTLLNALSKFVPDRERIITIEDAAEIQLQQEHVVRLEMRPPNVEGRGEVRIRDLVRNALRMRPDRIIVGEVRGGRPSTCSRR